MTDDGVMMIRSTRDVTPAVFEACLNLAAGSVEGDVSRAPLGAIATTSRLFRLSAQIAGADERRTLILKLPIGPEAPSELLKGCYQREVEVYSRLKALGIGVAPVCYSARFTGGNDFHLVLEDCASGAWQFSLDDSWGQDHLRALLRSAALLHARTSLNSHFDPEWLPILDHNPGGSVSDAIALFCDRFAEQLSPLEHALLAAVGAKEEALRTRLRGRPVLVHGDLHPLNVMFSGPSPALAVRLIDWQFAGRSVGAADLADVLGFYTPPFDREQNEQMMLEYYFDQWVAAGGTGYDRIDLEADYHVCLLLNLLKPVRLLGNDRLQHGVVLRLFKRGCLAVCASTRASDLMESTGALSCSATKLSASCANSGA